MEWTSLNILYIVLAICAGLLTIFLCTTLFHVINLLRDVEKVVYKIDNVADKANRFIAQPVRIAAQIAEGVDKLIGIVQRRFMGDEDTEE